MALALRRIEKARWYDPPWLEGEEVKADCVKDLETEDGNLSIFLVADDKSNLDRIVAALAANRQHITNFDYALVDIRRVENLGIRFVTTPGTTPDAAANGSHAVLIELTVSKLALLAKAIKALGERNRLMPKVIRELVRDGIAHQRIDRQQVAPGILEKIGEVKGA